MILILFQFLEESITGFQSSDGSSKSLCLEFIAPWLPNLARFISREQPDEQKASKVKRILEKLILLTVAEKEVLYHFRIVSCITYIFFCAVSDVPFHSGSCVGYYWPSTRAA